MALTTSSFARSQKGVQRNHLWLRTLLQSRKLHLRGGCLSGASDSYSTPLFSGWPSRVCRPWGNPTNGGRFIQAFFRGLQGASPARRERPVPAALAWHVLPELFKKAGKAQVIAWQWGQPLGFDADVIPMGFLNVQLEHELSCVASQSITWHRTWYLPRGEIPNGSDGSAKGQQSLTGQVWHGWARCLLLCCAITVIGCNASSHHSAKVKTGHGSPWGCCSNIFPICNFSKKNTHSPFHLLPMCMVFNKVLN